MNSIKTNSMTQLQSAQVSGSFSNSPATGASPFYLLPVCAGLLLSCSLSHAADSAVVPERVTANSTQNAPLHQHSSVEPKSPAGAASPDKPVPTSVPEDPESSAVPVPDNKIVIVSRPQVTGLWGMTIPGAKCIEYYNFMEKGDVVIKSGAEWTYGKYVYQVPATAEPGMPILAMRIQYDNQETDCSGNAIDQRGEDQQQYVKWTGPSSMEFCTSQDGTQCFASLRRVLP